MSKQNNQDCNHKTNVYRCNGGFLSKCICGWQKSYLLSDYPSYDESSARKDAEDAATLHLSETAIVKEYLRRVAAKAGRVKSAKKANSSRLNGKKGGRPMIPVDIDALTENEILCGED